MPKLSPEPDSTGGGKQKKNLIFTLKINLNICSIVLLSPFFVSLRHMHMKISSKI
jgi:hypothetical protein